MWQIVIAKGENLSYLVSSSRKGNYYKNDRKVFKKDQNMFENVTQCGIF